MSHLENICLNEKNFRCMRMRNGIRCTFMWFISFHRPYVRMHCSACENISGVSRFLSLAAFLSFVLVESWSSHLCCDNPIQSSCSAWFHRHFPKANKRITIASARREKSFPRIYYTTANRITLIQRKMCCIIKVNHRRTKEQTVSSRIGAANSILCILAAYAQC